MTKKKIMYFSIFIFAIIISRRAYTAHVNCISYACRRLYNAYTRYVSQSIPPNKKNLVIASLCILQRNAPLSLSRSSYVHVWSFYQWIYVHVQTENRRESFTRASPLIFYPRDDK